MNDYKNLLLGPRPVEIGALPRFCKSQTKCKSQSKSQTRPTGVQHDRRCHTWCDD